MDRRRPILVSFGNRFGLQQATTIKAIQVETWLTETYPTINSTTRSTRIGWIKRLFSWAEQQQLIERSPIARMAGRRKRCERNSCRRLSGRHYWTHATRRSCEMSWSSAWTWACGSRSCTGWRLGITATIGSRCRSSAARARDTRE